MGTGSHLNTQNPSQIAPQEQRIVGERTPRITQESYMEAEKGTISTESCCCLIHKAETKGLSCGAKTMASTDSETNRFDCNICLLEFALEPVVSLCGHLFCWPCIYKWMQASSGLSTTTCCPTCKAPISEKALIPLYGQRSLGGVKGIPARPAACRQAMLECQPSVANQEVDQIVGPSQRHDNHQQQHYMPTSLMGGTAIAILPWLLGNKELAEGIYYSSPYLIRASGGNPRLRRQELRMEVWLHQLWVLFFCCALLCFFFF